MAQKDLTIAVRARDESSSALNGLKDNLRQVKDSASGVNGSIGSMAGAMAIGTTVAGLASSAFGFVKSALTECVAAAQEAELGQAQLASVLASTGGVAGVTAAQANELAASLSNLTTYSDDEVLSAENLTLTFTNVSSSVFPKATQAILDMSTAMGQDLKSSAIQLGKALNDPAQGASALTKVGVSLTEQQIEQVKAFQDSGDVMSAQNIILKELSNEFGGAAEAAANTYTGRMKQLSNSIGEVQENIGKAMLPALGFLASSLKEATDGAQTATSANDNLSRTMYSIAAASKGVVLYIISIVKTIALFAKTLGYGASVAYSFGSDVVSAFKNVAEIGQQVFSAITKAIQGDFSGALDTFRNAFKFDFSATKASMQAAKDLTLEGVEDITSTWSQGSAAFAEAFTQGGFKPVSEATDALTRRVAGAMGSGGPVSKAAQQAAEEFAKAAQKVKDLGQSVSDKLADILKDYADKSEGILEQHNKTVEGINQAFVDENTSFSNDMADRQKAYYNDVLNSYIQHTAELDRIDKQRKEASEKLSKEADPTKINAIQEEIAGISAEYDKQKAIVAQYQKEFGNIEAEAAVERAKTDLDRLTEKYNQERTAAEQEHAQKIIEIQQRQAEELAQYQKAKEELVADTIDKYAKISEETNRGWQKIIDDTKVKVSEMKTLEQQVQAIKASIESARASVSAAKGGAVATPQVKLAAGGIVTSPTVALIGEAGPEAVIPLSKMQTSGTGGGTSITLNIGTVLGGSSMADTAREIGDLIVKQLQLNARIG